MLYLIVETIEDVDLSILKNQKDEGLNFRSLEIRYTLNSTLVFIKFKKNMLSKGINELKVKYSKERLSEFFNSDKILSINIKNYDDIKSILKPPVNRTVKAKSSKDKGKRLEDIVAKLFQKKLGLKEGTVHRAQSSGTFQYDIGDIKFNLPIHLVVECKNHESWSFKQLLNNSDLPSIFKDWIKQVKNEIKKASNLYPGEENILWFLIFSKNNESIYLLTDKETIDNLLHRTESPIRLKNDIRLELPHIYLDNYRIYNLEKFLECLSINL